MKVLFVGNAESPQMGGSHTFITTVTNALKEVKSDHTFEFGVDVNQHYDFTWFLSPNAKFAQCITPFAFTVWDVAHRVHPYFPEVSLTGWKFDSREARYRDALPRASVVSVGTTAGAKQLADYWRVNPNLILINPLPVSPAFAGSGDVGILPKLNLAFSRYLLYPAQFWPHKNHITLIDALKLLPEDFKLVFTGADKGNQKYVFNYAQQLPADRVVFAGFVSTEELVALYRNAHAMVYASVMGPDNLPPLEALACGCPVVCAEYDGARDQLGDAVLYFDPYDAEAAAAAVLAVLPGVEFVPPTAENYAANIVTVLDRFAKVRRLWGRTYTHL